MLTRENYRGVFAYPPTPFTKDLKLDEDTLRENLRKLIAVGVEGIVLAGTSGESYTLTDDETRRVASILREETAKAGVASVMGAIALSTEEIVHKGRIATEAGIDGVLALAPYHAPLTDLELVRFWKDVSAGCPDIGLLVYHYGWVRQTYSLETFRRLAGEIPNLIGSKEAHWDFKKWRAVHRGSPLAHMSSTDIGWLTELHREGAVGVGSVHIVCMPHKVREVLDHCAAGDYLAAERAQRDFTEFTARFKLGQGQPHVYPPELEALETYNPLARHKALIDAFGFLRVGPVRAPGLSVPDDLIGRIRDYAERHYPELLPTPERLAVISRGRPLWHLAEEPVLA